MEKEIFNQQLYTLVADIGAEWWGHNTPFLDDGTELVSNIVNDFYNDQFLLPCYSHFKDVWNPAENGFDGTMDEESIWYDFSNDEAGPAIRSWFDRNGPRIMPDLIRAAFNAGVYHANAMMPDIQVLVQPMTFTDK